jgi:hypothetical protein
VLVKSSEAQRWTVSELKTMVQWFTLPRDPTMPAQKQDIMHRYEQTNLRTVTGTHHEDLTINADITTHHELPNEPEPTDAIGVGIETMVN